MKAVVAAIIACALLGACSYHEDKTTVARPAPVPGGYVTTEGATTSTTTSIGIN
jgi:hypothetical protein